MSAPTADETWLQFGRRIGWRVLIYDKLDSTNSLGLQFADSPVNDGRIFVARQQTAGRGQYGRSWQAPPGSSVLLSVLLFPPESLRRPALLTAWAAVSVCETIDKIANLQATIKWPNDVLIQGKKVCGILIEQRTTPHADFPLATVVGIGLNISQSAEDFAQAGLPDAASLASLSGLSLDYEEVAKALIHQLDEQYHQLLNGDFHTLEANWKRRLDILGRTVFVEDVRQSYRGRLLGVSLVGIDLEVGGEVLRLAPESIRHITYCGD